MSFPRIGMYKIMKVQSREYFHGYHKSRLEDLKTMLENEMWIAIPVHVCETERRDERCEQQFSFDDD